jgi:hypothetical protein
MVSRNGVLRGVIIFLSCRCFSFPLISALGRRWESWSVLTKDRDEFLRDGDRLAAHMNGTMDVDGAKVQFESFMIGKVEEGTGKLAWLIERAVWGPVGAEPTEGVN